MPRNCKLCVLLVLLTPLSAPAQEGTMRVTLGSLQLLLPREWEAYKPDKEMLAAREKMQRLAKEKDRSPAVEPEREPPSREGDRFDYHLKTPELKGTFRGAVVTGQTWEQVLAWSERITLPTRGVAFYTATRLKKDDHELLEVKGYGPNIDWTPEDIQAMRDKQIEPSTYFWYVRRGNDTYLLIFMGDPGTDFFKESRAAVNTISFNDRKETASPNQ